MLRRLLKPLLSLPVATLVVYSIYATSTYVAHEEARQAWKRFASQVEITAPTPPASAPVPTPAPAEAEGEPFATLQKAEAAEATLTVAGIMEAARLAQSANLPAALQKEALSSEELAAIQTALERLQPLERFAQSLRAERARFLAQLDKAPRELLPQPSPEIRPETLRTLFLLNVKEETVLFQNKMHYGQFIERHLTPCFDLEAGRFNAPKIQTAIEELTTSLAQAPIAVERFASAAELLRFFEHDAPAVARFQAWRAQAVVAVALARYKAEHGAFPSSLAALQPGFLDSLPPDPLTGEPLLYSTSGSGFTLSATSWEKALGDETAQGWSWGEDWGEES